MATALCSRTARVRAAIANGTRMHLHPIDGRTRQGRRFRDLVEQLTAERGGPESLDTVKQQAIRRYASLVVECETMEAALAAGRQINSEAYGVLADRIDRVARRMGPVKAPSRPSLRERYAMTAAG